MCSQIFGGVTEWLNVEQPKVQNLKADLLARCTDGSLRQLELQTTNEKALSFRMLEYYVGFLRGMGEHVQQTVLYAGKEPLSMPDAFTSPSTNHRYTILNLREMDGEPLLESPDWADNQ